MKGYHGNPLALGEGGAHGAAKQKLVDCSIVDGGGITNRHQLKKAAGEQCQTVMRTPGMAPERGDDKAERRERSAAISRSATVSSGWSMPKLALVNALTCSRY